MVTKPTIEDLRSAWMEDHEDFEQVHEYADPSWRHGCYMRTIFKRLSDDTFWLVYWQKDGTGDYNSLRDREESDSSISQVWPHQVTKTEYLGSPPPANLEGTD